MNVYKVVLRREPAHFGTEEEFRTLYVLADSLSTCEVLIKKDQAELDESFADFWQHNNGYRRGRGYGEEIKSVRLLCFVNLAEKLASGERKT